MTSRAPASAASNHGPFGRRLVALAFADVVGYSALMAEDEDGTVARWTALRRDVVEGRLRAHRGHLLKVTGDGLLAEFASVLDAVAWSRDVQAAMAAANETRSDAEPIELRIALNLCDVIDEDADVYGDGVNVAARLQEHAVPGGIVMTDAVYDIARISVDLEAENLGFLELKNIPAPVHAYQVLPSHSFGSARGSLRRAALPSIAVLPLQTLSADASDSYFGDGIVEDIVVSLAGLRELLVISRASTVVYGSQRADPRDVGRALGVRYALMGSVRRAGERIRVAIQLYDAVGGACLWAETFAASLGDLFEIQDEIVHRVVAGIAPNVRASELRQALRKRPRNFTAYDHALRGIESLHSLDRQAFTRSREFLEQATTIDPDFAMPMAWLARWYSLWVGQGWSASPSDDSAKGLALAAKAIELDSGNSLALATCGHMRSYLYHDYRQAQAYLERARRACPNSAVAWVLSSATMSYLARGEEAVRFAEHGLRLSPYDRSLYLSYFFLGLAHYSRGELEEAVKWCELSRSENPAYTANLRVLAAASAGLGLNEQAGDAAHAMLRLEASFSLKRYEATRQPFADEGIRASFLEQLRAAGLPE